MTKSDENGNNKMITDWKIINYVLSRKIGVTI